MRYFIKPTHLKSDYISVGWGNGYVVLDKNHPWNGKDYDDIDVETHGGLTFANSAKSLDKKIWPEITDEERANESWVIGFDTAHLNDSPITCPESYVKAEAKKLFELAEKEYYKMYKY